MRKYVSIEEEVDADFTRVRRRSFVRHMGARLRGDPSSTRSLLSFEEVRKALGVSGRVRLGLRVVPVGRIVDSLGRHRDFDRDFLPAKAGVEEKWKRLDQAFHRGEEFPPVALYKVGEAYFVEDGNHRVRFSLRRSGRRFRRFRKRMREHSSSIAAIAKRFNCYDHRCMGFFKLQKAPANYRAAFTWQKSPLCVVSGSNCAADES